MTVAKEVRKRPHSKRGFLHVFAPRWVLSWSILCIMLPLSCLAESIEFLQDVCHFSRKEDNDNNNSSLSSLYNENEQFSRWICDPYNCLLTHDLQRLADLAQQFEAKSFLTNPPAELGIAFVRDGDTTTTSSSSSLKENPSAVANYLLQDSDIGGDDSSMGLLILVILPHNDELTWDHANVHLVAGQTLAEKLGRRRIGQIQRGIYKEIVACRDSDCYTRAVEYGVWRLTKVLEERSSSTATATPFSSASDDLSSSLQGVGSFCLFVLLRASILVLVLLSCQRREYLAPQRRMDTRDTADPRIFPNDDDDDDDHEQQGRKRPPKNHSYETDACPICLDAFRPVQVNFGTREEAPLLRTKAYLLVGADRRPLQYFKCGHCLCQTCWKQLVKTHSDQHEPIHCPICRRQVVVTDTPRRYTESALDQLRYSNQRHHLHTTLARPVRSLPTTAVDHRRISSRTLPMPLQRGIVSPPRRPFPPRAASPIAAPALAPAAWPSLLSTHASGSTTITREEEDSTYSSYSVDESSSDTCGLPIHPSHQHAHIPTLVYGGRNYQ